MGSGRAFDPLPIDPLLFDSDAARADGRIHAAVTASGREARTGHGTPFMPACSPRPAQDTGMPQGSSVE